MSAVAQSVAQEQARAWNERIRAVLRPDTPGAVPFFCECGFDHRLASVWLTLPEASRILERGGLIVGAHVFEDLDAQLGRGI